MKLILLGKRHCNHNYGCGSQGKKGFGNKCLVAKSSRKGIETLDIFTCWPQLEEGRT